MTGRPMGSSPAERSHGLPLGEATGKDSGGFWVKSKGSKPARKSGMLVVVAALAALAVSAVGVKRLKRREGRSG